MKLERVELREIHLPLRERFEISSGGRSTRRIILVRVTADGATGWGECVAGEDPSYSPETTETAWHVLESFLIPAALAADWRDARELTAPARWVRGHAMARAALEMAGWELEARRRGESLRALLGGTRDRVPVGVSIGIQPNDDALVAKVAQHVSEGYRKIKIKIKPGRDVESLSRVRERYPDTPIMADANSAYTLDDSDLLRSLDALGLMMIEQPLHHSDLFEHAELQRRIETPICLDESIRSLDDARLAIHLGSGRIVNIKPGRVGGFAEARAIHDLCVEHGIPVWCGGMLESGVGRSFNLALASLPGFTIPGDISASRRYWDRDIVDPEFEIDDGCMRVPDGVGIGVTPDLEAIERLTVRVRSYSA